MKSRIVLTEDDKKDYLENDLVDRLIRTEQKVSAKFGKFITYKETYTYKNLKKKNKERYERFIENKKKKKIFFATGLLISFLGLATITNNLTGMTITEINKKSIGLIEILIISLVTLIIILGLIFAIKKHKRKKYILSLFKPIDKIKRKNL